MLDYGICNLTYKLDKIERLLFELDCETVDVTQIFCKFLLIINIKSHLKESFPRLLYG